MAKPFFFHIAVVKMKQYNLFKGINLIILRCPATQDFWGMGKNVNTCFYVEFCGGNDCIKKGHLE